MSDFTRILTPGPGFAARCRSPGMLAASRFHSRVWSLSSSGNRLEVSVAWRKNIHRNRQRTVNLLAASGCSAQQKTKPKFYGAEQGFTEHISREDKMNIMRPLSAVLVVVSLSLAAVRAQDKGAEAPATAQRRELRGGKERVQ